VAGGWCWFVLREEYCTEEYCWLVAGGWFVLREKYCWLVAVLLAGCWWLVCSERKLLLAGGCTAGWLLVAGLF
jgi:hypothetical protein